VLRKAREKVEDDYDKVFVKIHRIPASLRKFCEDRQYIAPKMVAMSPKSISTGAPKIVAGRAFQKIGAGFPHRWP
jgi:hypothetical protein